MWVIIRDRTAVLCTAEGVGHSTEFKQVEVRQINMGFPQFNLNVSQGY